MEPHQLGQQFKDSMIGDSEDIRMTLEDLQQRIMLSIVALSRMSDESINESRLLWRTGWLYFRLWELTDQNAEFRQALAYFRQLQEPDRTFNDLERQQHYTMMASLLMYHCEQSDDIAQIDCAITNLDTLLQETRSEIILLFAACSKRRRYRKLHSVDDLTSAIALLEERWKITQHGSTELTRDSTLELLYNEQIEMFNRTQESDWLRKAIESAERRRRLDYEPSRPMYLSDLSEALAQQFALDRQMYHDKIDSSIEYGLQALRLMRRSPTDPYVTILLTSLSKHYLWRYESKSKQKDLDEAIIKSSEAVNTVERIGTSLEDRQKTRIYDMDSYVLAAKFGVTGNSRLLDQAIQRARQSVEYLPANDPARLDFLATLPRLLLRRSHHQGGNVDDTNEAIRFIDDELSSDIVYQNQKGMLLQLSSEARGHMADIAGKEHRVPMLNKAISSAQMALDATAIDDKERPGRLYRLGVLLGTRYSTVGEAKRSSRDLADAILFVRKAVETTSDANPLWGFFVDTLSSFLLGELLQQKGELPTQPKLQEICELLTKVVNTETMNPMNRLKCARRVTSLLVMTDRKHGSVQAMPIAKTAIGLLRKASSRVLNQNDQQDILRHSAGLATLAAALVLSENRSDSPKALEMIELGREVINQNRLDLQPDTTTLRRVNPTLAAELEEIRVQFQAATNPISDPLALGDTYAGSDPMRAHNLSDLFDSKVNQIRKEVDGLQNFLGAGYTVDEMKTAAGEGVIVYIVVAHVCDAIIVSHNGISSLRLERLHNKDIKKSVKQVRTMRRQPGYQSRDLRKILEWLWDAAVGPILDHLGFTKPPAPGEQWTRVWWIPTGALSLLPLHAAGYHNRIGANVTALDRVISSYSSSIKTLIHSRRGAASKGQQDQTSQSPSALLVSMRETPGVNRPLIYAEKEVEKVCDILPSQIETIRLPKPIKNDVLSSLPTCSVFHFAGHGMSDPVDPSKSRILLHDWKANPLTVPDIAALQLGTKSPWLAYLAACSTGEMRDEELYDEVIHLVNAFQVAGFCHVVGSFWEVSDRHCVEVAQKLYETVKDEIGTSDQVAYGLHRAARYLRDERTLPVRQDQRDGNLNADTCSSRDVDDENAGNDTRKYGFGDPFIWAAFFHVGL